MTDKEFELKAVKCLEAGNIDGFFGLNAQRLIELTQSLIPSAMSEGSAAVYAAAFHILADAIRNTLDDKSKALADALVESTDYTIVKIERKV